jgi:hypothetical protein
MSIDVTGFHKSDKDRVGFVADYCPVCRTLRAFSLYFLTLRHSGIEHTLAETPEESGFARVCRTCGTSFSAVPDTYSGTSPKLLDLAALKDQTFRNYESEYAAQLRLDRIPAARLMGQDRVDRIQGPLLAIALAAESRKSDNKMDRISWTSLAVALVLVVIAWPRIAAAGENYLDYPPLLVGPAILAVAVAFTRMGIAGRAGAIGWATGHLANALAPIQPSDAELETALHSLGGRNLWLAKKFSVASLQSAFEDWRQKQNAPPA